MYNTADIKPQSVIPHFSFCHVIVIITMKGPKLRLR